jgi:hypothetical protein
VDEGAQLHHAAAGLLRHGGGPLHTVCGLHEARGSRSATYPLRTIMC